jgi:hypothetical protein
LDPVVSAIETEGVTAAFTATVIEFDVAFVGDAQAAFEVRMQLTI